ncbi:MAG: RNA 2',3'-cyclic phosphodiesterase [Lachnospiraceae bacterium]|nr:RNA 2',3'-cyclic phosphodiesterase [Lachnospiraceae bacterium]
MRLFIAIEFDEAFLQPLIDLQEDMRSLGVGGNYTKRENLHLTLAFIGDYGDPGAVLDAMGEAAFQPFPIRLHGVGSFGDLFWVGLEKNEELMKLVKRLRRALACQGIPFDRKRFSPHITIIRKTSYRGGEAIPVTEPPYGHMTVGRISLMRSDRGKNGMIYTELGSV